MAPSISSFSTPGICKAPQRTEKRPHGLPTPQRSRILQNRTRRHPIHILMLPGCKPRTVPPRSILGSSTERTQGAYTTSAHTAGRPSGQHISPRRRIPEGTYPLRRIDSPRISVIILKNEPVPTYRMRLHSRNGIHNNIISNGRRQNDFDYVVDRFADIEVLRYPVPDFDKLSLSQKMLVYHLTEAALAGRDILWDQNCRLNLELRDMLEKNIHRISGRPQRPTVQGF